MKEGFGNLGVIAGESDRQGPSTVLAMTNRGLDALIVKRNV